MISLKSDSLPHRLSQPYRLIRPPPLLLPLELCVGLKLDKPTRMDSLNERGEVAVGELYLDRSIGEWCPACDRLVGDQIFAQALLVQREE